MSATGLNTFNNCLLELPKAAIDVNLIHICERSELIFQFQLELIDCPLVFKMSPLQRGRSDSAQAANTSIKADTARR